MIPLEIQPRPTRLYKEPASGKAVLEEHDQRRSFFSMQRDLKKKYMVGNSSKDKAVSIKKRRTTRITCKPNGGKRLWICGKNSTRRRLKWMQETWLVAKTNLPRSKRKKLVGNITRETEPPDTQWDDAVLLDGTDNDVEPSLKSHTRPNEKKKSEFTFW